MSFRNVPLFDILADQQSIYPGFGPVLPHSQARLDRFIKLADQATERIQSEFLAEKPQKDVGIETLDGIIEQMWSEDWDPQSGDINLFSTDFGLVLTRIIQALVGGRLVFRSETDLNHVSLYWPDRQIEVFPFHKIYKCLANRTGESLKMFVEAIRESNAEA